MVLCDFSNSPGNIERNYKFKPPHSIIRMRLSFDILSLVIHAFPERYAELLWTEMENQLREALESTYMAILAVINRADIMSYLCSKPR